MPTVCAQRAPYCVAPAFTSCRRSAAFCIGISIFIGGGALALGRAIGGWRILRCDHYLYAE